VDGVFGALVAGALLHVVAVPHPSPGAVRPGTVAASSPPTPLLPSSVPLRFVPVGVNKSALRLAAPRAAGSLLRAADECGTGCGHGHDHSHDHAHAPHDEAAEEKTHAHTHAHGSQAGERAWSASGVVAGAAMLAAFSALASSEGAALPHVSATLDTLFVLLLDSAPALVAGFAVSGVVIALVEPARARWLAGRSPLGGALRGVVFGLPLPICSCGVVPLYRTLHRQGVPATAGMAFLVATPELGLDAVLLSIPLLGWELAAARVIGAFAVALLVGVVVGRGVPAPVCTPAGGASAAQTSLRLRLRRGLAFGLGELVDHSLPWIAAGLLLAALAEPLLAHGLVAGFPAWLQVPFAAAVGVPMYVCASGATPLAAIAMHKGLSSGAALAFLLAGPATNVTTFGMLTALHGRKVAFRFGLVLTGIAVLLGWGVDAAGLTPVDGFHFAEVRPDGRLAAWIAAATLLALGVRSLYRQGARGVLAQVLDPGHAH
jgi:uncharacterized membrane protein YraQ (UPF0718 family)